MFPVFLLLCCLCAPPLSGALFDWTFEVAGDPDIAGPPGSTIGWGYTISNLDPGNWLAPTAVDADLFQHASPLVLFDFPILAPNQTVTVFYDPVNFFGLYQLTWDLDAPAGFVNAGTFVITSDWYDDDPLAGGNLLPPGSTRSASYSATVGVVVPEPASAQLIVLALAAAAIVGRRHDSQAAV